MTSTTTSVTSTSTCTGASLYELPQQSAACGIPNTSKYESIFNECALPAGVRSYRNDCALWAPAVDQSVQDLIDCLYGKGVEWEDIWCSGSRNGTETGGFPTPTVITGDADGAEATGDGDNGGVRVVVGWGVFGVAILGALSLL
ncbi:hypothetical protein BJX70DRAFT_394730 [Aspergillus crustosus]